MKAIKKRVTILKNGPYAVTGGVPLNNVAIARDEGGASRGWVTGKEYALHRRTYCLCRCGHSRIKPMCDGTHAEKFFQGGEAAARPPYAQRAEFYEGKVISLFDDKSLCVAARFCAAGDSLRDLLVESDDPEILAMVLREVCDCPGGRLTAVTRDGVALEPELPEELSLVNDPGKNWRGPLWVKGGIPIEGDAGEAYEVRNRVALCRCGESANMPYCDATHYACPHMEGQDE